MAYSRSVFSHSASSRQTHLWSASPSRPVDVAGAALACRACLAAVAALVPDVVFTSLTAASLASDGVPAAVAAPSMQWTSTLR